MIDRILEGIGYWLATGLEFLLGASAVILIVGLAAFVVCSTVDYIRRRRAASDAARALRTRLATIEANAGAVREDRARTLAELPPRLPRPRIDHAVPSPARGLTIEEIERFVVGKVTP